MVGAIESEEYFVEQLQVSVWNSNVLENIGVLFVCLDKVFNCVYFVGIETRGSGVLIKTGEPSKQAQLVKSKSLMVT